MNFVRSQTIIYKYLNTKPTINLTVDDGGDCTHFKLGDKITGSYSVFDKHISRWNLGSTWGGVANGFSNTGFPNPTFEIQTNANSHPCGRISLYAVDRTIVNSQSVGRESYAGYNVCLKS